MKFWGNMFSRPNFQVSIRLTVIGRILGRIGTWKLGLELLLLKKLYITKANFS